VTKSSATTQPNPPVFPPGRYGRRRAPHRNRRWAVWLAGFLVAAAGFLVATRLYVQYGDPAYDAQAVRFTDVTDSQVVITFRVNVPRGRSAICVVRALAADGREVGQAGVPVPEGRQSRTEVTYRLVTTARPTRAQVVRCRPGG
jgi:hypothetical protein